MNRRHYLSIVSTSAAAGLAGCSGVLTDLEHEVVEDELDATSWDACDARSTRQRSLRAIAAIADACETTAVAGPKVDQYLMHRHPEWSECVTERRNPGRREPQSDAASSPSPDELEIYAELQQMRLREGKLKILSHLERNSGATEEDLAEDPENSLKPGLLRPYLQALVDDHELVAVDTSGRYNTYRLSSHGQTAMGLVADDGLVVHPDQDTILGGFEAARTPVLMMLSRPPSQRQVQCAGPRGRGRGWTGWRRRRTPSQPPGTRTQRDSSSGSPR